MKSTEKTMTEKEQQALLGLIDSLVGTNTLDVGKLKGHSRGKGKNKAARKNKRRPKH